MPFINNSAARLPDETWETYQKRRLIIRKAEKLWLRGRELWNSKEKGTSRAK
jgi:hypothetical protein